MYTIRAIQQITTRIFAVLGRNGESKNRLPLWRECFPRDTRHYGVYYAFISRRELVRALELPCHGCGNCMR